MPVNFSDTLDVFSRTLWAEARSEGRLGIEAVASVILTRAAHPRWWGRDVRGVCLMQSQFSCWLPTDPQHSAIRSDGIMLSAAMVECCGIARIALAGNLVDITHGADSYANLSTCRPAWARGKVPVATIGRHTFFRLEVPPPGKATGGGMAAPVCVPPPRPASPPQPPDLGSADALNGAELTRLSGGQA